MVLENFVATNSQAGELTKALLSLDSRRSLLNYPRPIGRGVDGVGPVTLNVKLFVLLWAVPLERVASAAMKLNTIPPPRSIGPSKYPPPWRLRCRGFHWNTCLYNGPRISLLSALQEIDSLAESSRYVWLFGENLSGTSTSWWQEPQSTEVIDGCPMHARTEFPLVIGAAGPSMRKVD